MNDSISSDDEISDINKIVQDAKDLYEKLIEDEETANQLLCKATFLNNAAVTMVEYQDIIDDLDEDSKDNPNPSQTSAIITESRQLNQLQNENAQLKMALEDHQFALELIMSKYRQQVCRFLNYQKCQKMPMIKSSCSTETVHQLSTRIKDMSQVMMDAIEADEDSQVKRDRIISQLKVENDTLRELVKIALQFESLKIEDVPSDILLNIR
ncbi:FGFR1 oncogene partner 2 homolog [Tetranychus urticae]|uniref:Uncharacterized protein n=1 Tax=Tetranychus urticae TaxID=32264 RepID=T1K327_TETUR|nr:FGFR1 oncogene partner 2 homolog [Tetranychus urticae]